MVHGHYKGRAAKKEAEAWFAVLPSSLTLQTRRPETGQTPRLGDHDWNTILTRWDLLQYDTLIADALNRAGWTGTAAICARVLRRAWCDRRRPALRLACVT